MSRLCPACGGSGAKKYPQNIDYERFSSTTYASRKSPEYMHYALSECSICVSLFVETLPNAGELLQNYSESAFDSQIESEFAARTYCKYLTRLNLIKGKKLIDVGSGDGAFLRLALNFGSSSVTGVEPSIGALKSASEMSRFIRVEPIESCNFESEFDLATCFQTLEHVANPAETISKITESVVVGGHVAVVCHDRLSFVNRLLGKRSPIFDIEHLQMFSRRGLESLLQRNGLKIVCSRPITNRYPLGYWLRLLPLPKIMTNLVERRRRSTALKVPISLRVGNRLVVAQK